MAMKRFLIVILLLLFLLESCVVANSRSFRTPLKGKPKNEMYYNIQMLKDKRIFFIPPFFLYHFDKKRGLYLLEYSFNTKNNLIYSELININYIFYNETGEEFANGNFDINSKVEEFIMTENIELKIAADTSYLFRDRTAPQIMIPDSIKKITADFTIYFRKLDGNIDSLSIKEECELDRRKGIYSFF